MQVHDAGIRVQNAEADAAGPALEFPRIGQQAPAVHFPHGLVGVTVQGGVHIAAARFLHGVFGIVGEGELHAVPGEQDVFRVQARRRGAGGQLAHDGKLVVIVARNGVQREAPRQFNQALEALRGGAVAQEHEMSAVQQAHLAHRRLQVVRAVVHVGKNAYLHGVGRFMAWMGQAFNSSGRGGRGACSPSRRSRQVKPPAPAP